jgi:parallel beta-helix repeat protein
MAKADLPSSDDVLLGKYNRYTFLYTKTGKTSAENTELAGLQTDLANYIITASEWNGMPPRAATLVVAASNSSAAGKASADYVCTGTNDHTVINSAITALGTNAGKVVLLEGLFAIAASINLPSNVSLEGQGDATVLQIPNANNATFNMIQNADSTNGNTGIDVSNLKIDGNNANNTTGTQMIGVKFTKVTYSTIENITVTNMRTDGIYLLSSDNNTITGNTVTSSILAGIRLVTCKGNTVFGNVCQGGNNTGIAMYTSCTYNLISGNICQGNNYNGLTIDSSTMNAVLGNMCVENSQVTHNTYDNILLSNSANYNNVQGNTCRQGALTNKPKYGIEVATNNCTGNLITNNDLTTGGATGAFSDLGTSTVTTSGNKLA